MFFLVASIPFVVLFIIINRYDRLASLAAMPDTAARSVVLTIANFLIAPVFFILFIIGIVKIFVAGP